MFEGLGGKRIDWDSKRESKKATRVTSMYFVHKYLIFDLTHIKSMY